MSHDLVIDGVTVAHAGDRIILVPVTTSRAVMVGNTSLEDLWDTLSKVGHTHTGYETALANYQAELIRSTNRITALEQAITPTAE